EKVTVSDLQDVLDSTQFVWCINGYSDDFLEGFTNLAHRPFVLTTAFDVTGFVASVRKPRNLKVEGTDDRATVDLFVNGRLREKDILKHIPTQRIVESYLYGQVHVDSMDRVGTDPFTSSREGIVEDDEVFRELLAYLKEKAFPRIFDLWDEHRLKRGEGGDEDNFRKSKKERKARDLYAASRDDYMPDRES